MQAASAVQVDVQRFGVWNIALGLLSATTVSVAAAWLATRNDELPGWSGMLLVAIVLVGVVLGVADMLRRQPVALRWDGQRWHVTDRSRGADPVEVSDLRVVLDLGAWMLLRLRCDESRRALRRGWIPVQRRGIESHWHALRCALYTHGTASIRPTALDRQARRG